MLSGQCFGVVEAEENGSKTWHLTKGTKQSDSTAAWLGPEAGHFVSADTVYWSTGTPRFRIVLSSNAEVSMPSTMMQRALGVEVSVVD